MSSEFLSASRRTFGRVFLFAAIAASLAACQVRPLYSSSSATPHKLASIKISPAGDRVSQVVRNQLIFLFNLGSGEPAKADYNLQMSVSSARSNILDDEIVTTTTPGRVTVTANYTLTRISDGKVLRTGTRAVTSLVDIGAQEFAKLRGYRDAEDRAGRELAEFIQADVAIALSRQD